MLLCKIGNGQNDITGAPPKIPTISARTASSGITSIAATRRGRTRKVDRVQSEGW